MDFVFFSPLQPFEVAKDKKKNWKNLKKKNPQVTSFKSVVWAQNIENKMY